MLTKLCGTSVPQKPRQIQILLCLRSDCQPHQRTLGPKGVQGLLRRGPRAEVERTRRDGISQEVERSIRYPHRRSESVPSAVPSFFPILSLPKLERRTVRRRFPRTFPLASTKALLPSNLLQTLTSKTGHRRQLLQTRPTPPRKLRQSSRRIRPRERRQYPLPAGLRPQLLYHGLVRRRPCRACGEVFVCLVSFSVSSSSSSMFDGRAM